MHVPAGVGERAAACGDGVGPLFVDELGIRETPFGGGLVEVPMERGIAPGKAFFVDQALEPTDEDLAQSCGIGLIRGITVIDPAPQGAGPPRGATAGRVLPGTRLARVER